MSIDTSTRLTAEEFLDYPDNERFELVDGELRELNMSEDSSWIAGRILRLLGLAEDKGLGWVFPEGAMFRCFPDDPQRVRKPDCSFIRREQRPHGPESVGFTELVPDLVVEVVSPKDLAWDVSEKVSDWQNAGVPEVWVVMPAEKSVVVYQRNNHPQFLTADDEITFNLIPEFRCQVADFFPPSIQSGSSR